MAQTQNTVDTAAQRGNILSIPPEITTRLSDSHITDLVSYFDPDAIFIPGHERADGVFSALTAFNGPIIYPANDSDATGVYSINGVDVVVIYEYSDLESLKVAEQKDLIDTTTETYVLSNLLETHINRDALETSLRGRSEYEANLGIESLSGTYTHLTGLLPSSYAETWGDLTVRGCAPEDSQGRPPLPCLSLRTDGYVTAETLSPDSLGLQAISGVGPTTAERLHDAGFSKRHAIADADEETLQEVKGIGPTRADQFKQNATALVDGTTVRTSDSPVPGHDPIFIDIETDGLNASVTWLIGVKDGIDGNYMSFITRDPEQPGKAVTDFMRWVDANARDRTFITWNGWNFDFNILREHIVEYCPELLDTWKALSKRDLLRWAVDLDNAVLPARSNKLEPVAEALGWETDNTGLTGRAVGRAYREFLRNPCTKTELAWERHIEYCRDDVEALEHIYRELRGESRLASAGGGSRSVEETTSQGSLTEW